MVFAVFAPCASPGELNSYLACSFHFMKHHPACRPAKPKYPTQNISVPASKAILAP